MTAREAVSPVKKPENLKDGVRVEGGMHLLDVLPRLLDTPTRELTVEVDGEAMGIIDQTSLLEALGREIAPRDDSSMVEFECAPSDYSASQIAHAVEDVDVHLVDLLTTPGDEGRVHVTLRVRCEDPTATVHSLERYGYEVKTVHGNTDASSTAAVERILALQALINV